MGFMKEKLMSQKGVYVKGQENLAKTLARLSKKGLDTAMKKSVREATKIIKRDAKAYAPHATGNIKRSIQRKSRFSKSRGEYVGMVSTRDPVAHLIEFGVKPHWIWRSKPGGRSRRGSGSVYEKGKIRHPGYRANPFLTSSILKNEDYIIQRANAIMFDEIKKVKGA